MIYYRATLNDGTTILFTPETVDEYDLIDKYYLDKIITEDIFSPSVRDGKIYPYRLKIPKIPLAEVGGVSELPKERTDGDAVLCYDLRAMFIALGNYWYEYPYNFDDYTERFYDDAQLMGLSIDCQVESR